VSDEHVTVKVLQGTPRPDMFLRLLKFECELGDGPVEMLVQAVWDQLTANEPQAKWAIEFHKNLRRRLKVGDVVVVREQAFAREPTGWRAVTVSPHQVWVEHCELATFVTEDKEFAPLREPESTRGPLCPPRPVSAPSVAPVAPGGPVRELRVVSADHFPLGTPVICWGHSYGIVTGPIKFVGWVRSSCRCGDRHRLVVRVCWPCGQEQHVPVPHVSPLLN